MWLWCSRSMINFPPQPSGGVVVKSLQRHQWEAHENQFHCKLSLCFTAQATEHMWCSKYLKALSWRVCTSTQPASHSDSPWRQTESTKNLLNPHCSCLKCSFTLKEETDVCWLWHAAGFVPSVSWRTRTWRSSCRKRTSCHLSGTRSPEPPARPRGPPDISLRRTCVLVIDYLRFLVSNLFICERSLTETQNRVDLEQGPVLLIGAVSRLDQHVTNLSGCRSSRNPHWPAVAVLSVHLYQLQKKYKKYSESKHNKTTVFSSSPCHHIFVFLAIIFSALLVPGKAEILWTEVENKTAVLD